MGWISIGLAVASIFFTIIWFYYKKRMTRLEALETAVFGVTGVHTTLNKYVTHEVLEHRLRDLTGTMRNMNEEGMRREERIIAAIQNQTNVLGIEIREIKEDVRNQSLRIDHVISNNNNMR
jgi:hypothetical protein